MFYVCSMSSDPDIAAQRQLAELTQLSLAVARDISVAIHETHAAAELIGLADAYAKVGRCLRMSVALAARLRSGDTGAPAQLGEREPAPKVEPELELERDESKFVEERGERPEARENLYDRLPPGDLSMQIATVARVLTSAARALPAVSDRYRARCDALVTEARRLHPAGSEGMASDPAWPPAERSSGSVVALAPNRARGPPRAI